MRSSLQKSCSIAPVNSRDSLLKIVLSRCSTTKRLLTDHARAELDLQIEAAIRENAGIRASADFREGIDFFSGKT